MKLEDLTIIVPCYNEEDCIGSVLQELIQFCEKHGCKLLVVNDGSRDNTADILAGIRSQCFSVVTHKCNRGYGGAIKTGIRCAVTHYVVTVDADGQHVPEDILKLYRKMLDTQADMVVGERDSRTDASLYRRVGKFIIKRIAQLTVPLEIKDINSGMKLYSRDIALQLLKLLPDGMAYSDTVLLLFSKFSCLCCGEPISIRQRQGGCSTIGWKTAVETVREICCIALIFSPLALCLKISVCFAILGIIWAIRCYMLNFSFSVGSCTCLIIAVLQALLGVFLEQMCRLRKQDIVIENYRKSK